MSSCVFTNDNNVEIKLIEHHLSPELSYRDHHEVLFRRINTYLINNNIIQRNIIDLGAWIGDNSIPWSKNIKGTVYAIDPSSENCDFIKKICEHNNITNLKIIEKAISDKNELLSTNDDMTHCSFVYGNCGVDGKHKMNAVSLDYLYEIKEIENIGYIHLDVEGMEYRIVQGADKLIDKDRPIITFEQHLELDDYNIILTHLNNKNYTVFLIDEVLLYCRPDCRNSIAFPNELFDKTIVNRIHEYIGRDILIQK
jgi:FkbM family methyltransferase